MYSIIDYGGMINDSVRMNAYVDALRAAVKPGSVVLDIGTGTGIFAILARQFGARRVYAVETGDAIWLARQMAEANGVADAIEFYQGMSTELSFPEKADVIISDLRGVLPLLEMHIPSIVDARNRLLAPGGVMIPLRDEVWMAAAQADEFYKWVDKPWSERPYGVDMSAAKNAASSQWFRAKLDPQQLLSDPACIGTLDYSSIVNPNFNGEITVPISRDGLVQGLCAWFDAILAEGISFSNAPGRPKAIYGKAFFPLPGAIDVEAGDTMQVRLRANLVGSDYVWSWNTRILGQGDPERIKANFRQSCFHAEPLSPEKFRRRSAAHVPALSEDGRIDQEILGMMLEEISLGDIARQLSDSHPERFPTWQGAMTRVGDLSSKYSR